jgi:hypothetical protein
MEENYCKNGHLIVSENICIWNNKSQCRLCRNDAKNKSYRKHHPIVKGAGGKPKTHCKYGHELTEKMHIKDIQNLDRKMEDRAASVDVLRSINIC